MPAAKAKRARQPQYPGCPSCGELCYEDGPRPSCLVCRGKKRCWACEECADRVAAAQAPLVQALRACAVKFERIRADTQSEPDEFTLDALERSAEEGLAIVREATAGLVRRAKRGKRATRRRS